MVGFFDAMESDFDSASDLVDFGLSVSFTSESNLVLGHVLDWGVAGLPGVSLAWDSKIEERNPCCVSELTHEVVIAML